MHSMLQIMVQQQSRDREREERQRVRDDRLTERFAQPTANSSTPSAPPVPAPSPELKIDQDRKRPPANLETPSWDGKLHSLSNYKLEIENMREQMNTPGLPTTVNRFPKFHRLSQGGSHNHSTKIKKHIQLQMVFMHFLIG